MNPALQSALSKPGYLTWGKQRVLDEVYAFMEQMSPNDAGSAVDEEHYKKALSKAPVQLHDTINEIRRQLERQKLPLTLRNFADVFNDTYDAIPRGSSLDGSPATGWISENTFHAMGSIAQRILLLGDAITRKTYENASPDGNLLLAKLQDLRSPIDFDEQQPTP